MPRRLRASAGRRQGQDEVDFAGRQRLLPRRPVRRQGVYFRARSAGDGRGPGLLRRADVLPPEPAHQGTAPDRLERPLERRHRRKTLGAKRHVSGRSRIGHVRRQNAYHPHADSGDQDDLQGDQDVARQDDLGRRRRQGHFRGDGIQDVRPDRRVRSDRCHGQNDRVEDCQQGRAVRHRQSDAIG